MKSLFSRLLKLRRPRREQEVCQRMQADGNCPMQRIALAHSGKFIPLENIPKKDKP